MVAPIPKNNIAVNPFQVQAVNPRETAAKRGGEIGFQGGTAPSPTIALQAGLARIDKMTLSPTAEGFMGQSTLDYKA